MPVIDVSSKDYAKVFKATEQARLERVKACVAEAAMLGAEVVAKRMPVDLGQLHDSVRAVPNGAPNEILVDAPHAGIIENGSRPHWAPFEAIYEWVQRHKLSFGIESDEEAKQVTAAIRAKIAREGTKPRWIMRNSLEDLRKILKVIVERRIGG